MSKRLQPITKSQCIVVLVRRRLTMPISTQRDDHAHGTSDDGKKPNRGRNCSRVGRRTARCAALRHGCTCWRGTARTACSGRESNRERQVPVPRYRNTWSTATTGWVVTGNVEWTADRTVDGGNDAARGTRSAGLRSGSGRRPNARDTSCRAASAHKRT